MDLVKLLDSARVASWFYDSIMHEAETNELPDLDVRSGFLTRRFKKRN